jgi:hypothetical protein
VRSVDIQKCHDPHSLAIYSIDCAACFKLDLVAPAAAIVDSRAHALSSKQHIKVRMVEHRLFQRHTVEFTLSSFTVCNKPLFVMLVKKDALPNGS